MFVNVAAPKLQRLKLYNFITRTAIPGTTAQETWKFFAWAVMQESIPKTEIVISTVG